MRAGQSGGLEGVVSKAAAASSRTQPRLPLPHQLAHPSHRASQPEVTALVSNNTSNRSLSHAGTRQEEESPSTEAIGPATSPSRDDHAASREHNLATTPENSPHPSSSARTLSRGSVLKEESEGVNADGSSQPAVSKGGARVAKACLPCSSKKRRCDGGRPECKVCAVLGTACSYNSSGLKRGPPKGFRSSPKESARVRLIRQLETTIRDLTAQLGTETAAIELERISAERGIQLPSQTSEPEGRSMPTPTAAPQDGLGQRSTSSEERDSEFLGINEKGEVSHRGSSSGIHLLHRQSQQQAPGKSPLKPHSAQPLTSLEGLADRGAESSAEGANRSGQPVSIVPLPLARPNGNRQNSGSDSSTAPLRGFPLRGVPVLSNGAQANRDHILNTLSPSGVASRRLLRGNVDSNGSSTSAGSSPRPEGRSDNADASEATALRACLVNIRNQTTLLTEQSQDLMGAPLLTEAANARLWRFYWSGFHPIWPILYKPALDELPLGELPARIDPVLLLAVYAIATCVGAPPREGSTKPITALNCNLDDELGERPGEILARRSEQYLYASRLRPCVSTIQAAFLLALYHHGQGDLSKAWTLSGLSQSLSMDLGFHRWPIHRLDLLSHTGERETRVRLIHHVRILGTLLSAEMGRPVLMHARDCDVPLLSENVDDELELWDDQVEMHSEESVGKPTAARPRYIHAASTLNQGVLLFNIIESILTSVHSFRRKAALRRQGTSRETLGELDRRLSAWKQDLPEHLRLEPTDLARLDSSGPLPSLFVLLVWYYTAILLLHRPFIPQDDDATLQEVLENSSHQKCTLAANTLSDLLEPTSVDMDRLSGDLAFCIFSASLLFLFNCGLSDKVIAADARRRFGLCRQWLGKLSSRWPAASAHKQLLDGVATVGESYMSERKDQHDDAGHRAVHAKSTKRPRSRASSKAQPPEKLSKTATSSASRNPTSTSEREEISSTLAASQGNAVAPSSRKAWSTSNERQAPAQSSTLPPTTSRVGVNSHSTTQAYRDADVSRADASQGSAEAMLLSTNQQPIWGGFAASAEQQRAIIDYLHGTNAYDIPSTGAEFYSHAPSLFDADTVFWNETAGRRDSIAGQQGVPQDGGPSMITAATASELYRQRHEQPAADGLAMLANVTARNGMLHESHHRQAFPATNSFLPNSTSVQAPGHGIAQPQPQSVMALLGNLPQQQRGDFQDAQNWSAFQQLSTSSPFGFQLDPSQPTWSDVMSMLQLPPSFSSDPRSQPSPAPLPPPRTLRRLP
ncbi:hypothetical protein IE81DRAFT_365748 [Ceraceosorus guamensis]|uniref:Zn(2)-C6 fungal-type domain-containing protein n=1 Tax=Ceraceosorus guamensis TaxID=1522189 RepID=A0A316W354_9BASI|nr:hypothetical protein IE81DRAFT_365748 [Ceraceosorus guamensis]PWN43528.1 hypothetical protein IE81DRAFT_365748 [Ceraceosorus guamensis]